MTEKQVLQAERVRLLKALTVTDPEQEQYAAILYHYQRLRELEKEAPSDDLPQTPEPPALEVVPEPEPVSEPEPEPEPAPEPEPEPEKVWTKQEVRSALGTARLKKGIDVSGLLRSFGADNFNALPASEYPALMKQLEEL